RGLEDATVFAIPKTVLQAKLERDLGFAARFYRALAVFLSTTVRERHRMLGAGSAASLDEVEEDDADELDPNVLDGIYLAGERFDRMVKRVLAA
ncbi:MAG TPA: cyclic nucleotide-binding protein, partial [Thermoanaerobaculia bacterium]|nr:cyclic nucleotide-binding protein [Thermoanaerobaculia bacterium]